MSIHAGNGLGAGSVYLVHGLVGVCALANKPYFDQQASEALEELCMAADELPSAELQALLAGALSPVAALRRTVVDVCARHFA